MLSPASITSDSLSTFQDNIFHDPSRNLIEYRGIFNMERTEGDDIRSVIDHIWMYLTISVVAMNMCLILEMCLGVLLYIYVYTYMLVQGRTYGVSMVTDGFGQHSVNFFEKFSFISLATACLKCSYWLFITKSQCSPLVNNPVLLGKEYKCETWQWHFFFFYSWLTKPTR